MLILVTGLAFAIFTLTFYAQYQITISTPTATTSTTSTPTSISTSINTSTTTIQGYQITISTSSITTSTSTSTTVLTLTKVIIGPYSIGQQTGIPNVSIGAADWVGSKIYLSESSVLYGPYAVGQFTNIPGVFIYNVTSDHQIYLGWFISPTTVSTTSSTTTTSTTTPTSTVSTLPKVYVSQNITSGPIVVNLYNFMYSSSLSEYYPQFLVFNKGIQTNVVFVYPGTQETVNSSGTFFNIFVGQINATAGAFSYAYVQLSPVSTATTSTTSTSTSTSTILQIIIEHVIQGPYGVGQQTNIPNVTIGKVSANVNNGNLTNVEVWLEESTISYGPYGVGQQTNMPNVSIEKVSATVNNGTFTNLKIWLNESIIILPSTTVPTTSTSSTLTSSSSTSVSTTSTSTTTIPIGCGGWFQPACTTTATTTTVTTIILPSWQTTGHKDVLLVTIGSNFDSSSAQYKNELLAYENLLTSEGFSYLYVDLSSSNATILLNSTPSLSSLQSIKIAINKLEYGTTPTYLIILGDVNIVPMPSVYTSVQFDENNNANSYSVPTDDPYGSLTNSSVPTIVVARIPGSNAAQISNFLSNAIKRHANNNYNLLIAADGLTGPNDLFMRTDASTLSTETTGISCTSNPNCLYSPQYCLSNLCNYSSTFQKDISSYGFQIYVCHGDGYVCTDKFGQYMILDGNAPSMNQTPIVMTTTACFDGTINYSGGTEPLALQIMDKGAAAYTGNTKEGWGGYSPPEATYIYNQFKSGKTIGQAFLDMKKNYLGSQYSSDDYWAGTAHETQLYGDPTISIGD